MLEYSGILLLLKLEKMNIKPLQAYFQVDNSGNKFPKAVYWSCFCLLFISSRGETTKMSFYNVCFLSWELIVIGRFIAQDLAVRDSQELTWRFSVSSPSSSWSSIWFTGTGPYTAKSDQTFFSYIRNLKTRCTFHRDVLKLNPIWLRNVKTVK